MLNIPVRSGIICDRQHSNWDRCRLAMHAMYRWLYVRKPCQCPQFLVGRQQQPHHHNSKCAMNFEICIERTHTHTQMRSRTDNDQRSCRRRRRSECMNKKILFCCFLLALMFHSWCCFVAFVVAVTGTNGDGSAILFIVVVVVAVPFHHSLLTHRIVQVVRSFSSQALCMRPCVWVSVCITRE